MARYQDYDLDMRGVTVAAATAAMKAHQEHPIEVAACRACGHAYMYHYASAGRVACVGCASSYRCSGDTLMPARYYPRHGYAD